MFLGKFEVPLDDRNRLVLPAAFRSALPADPFHASFALYPTHHRALRLFPLKPGAGIDEILEHEGLPKDAGSPDTQAALVDFMSSVCLLQMDKKYRVKIPDAARISAGIQHRAVLLGLSRLIEIWSPETWEERARAREAAVTQPLQPGS